jgi:hypothetical protein
MNWIRMIRGRSAVGALTLAVVLLLGVVLGGFHHHATARADDGCAVCTLAHTSAATPAVVTVPVAVAQPIQRPFIALLVAPRFESRATIASRAPPLG